MLLLLLQEAQRGYTQSTVYLVRATGQVLAVVLVGIFMNGYEYNGSFDWGLSFSQVCACLAAPAVIMIPVSWWGIPEEAQPDENRDTFEQYGTKVWTLLTGDNTAPFPHSPHPHSFIHRDTFDIGSIGRIFEAKRVTMLLYR